MTAYYSSAAMNAEGYFVQSGYQYMVVLNPDAPDEIIVVVYSENGDPVAAVVNGSSQESAEQIYHAYTEAGK